MRYGSLYGHLEVKCNCYESDELRITISDIMSIESSLLQDDHQSKIHFYSDNSADWSSVYSNMDSFPIIMKDKFTTIDDINYFIYDIIEVHNNTGLSGFFNSVLSFINEKNDFAGAYFNSPGFYRDLHNLSNSIYLPYILATKDGNGIFNQITFRFPLRKAKQYPDSIIQSGTMKLSFNVEENNNNLSIIGERPGSFVFDSSPEPVQIQNFSYYDDEILPQNISTLVSYKELKYSYYGNYWNSFENDANFFSDRREIFNYSDVLSIVIYYMQSALDYIKFSYPNNKQIQKCFIDFYNDYWDGDPESLRTRIIIDNNNVLNLYANIVYEQKPPVNPIYGHIEVTCLCHEQNEKIVIDSCDNIEVAILQEDFTTITRESESAVNLTSTENYKLVHSLFTPIDPTFEVMDDEFGINWAYNITLDRDENYIVCSAPSAGKDNYDYVGNVQIFNANTGELVRILDNPNAYSTPEYDAFGSSVAIKGAYCAVTASREKGNFPGEENSDVGWVYVFNVNTGALLHSIENPNIWGGSVGGDSFGKNISILGNYLIIGSYGEAAGYSVIRGAVYIFNIITGELLRTIPKPASNTGYNHAFGGYLKSSNDYLIIGNIADSGYINIYDTTNFQLLRTLSNPNAPYMDGFGGCYSISGNLLVVGASNEVYNEAGRAYIYDLSTGNILHTFVSPNPSDPSISFGKNVAINNQYAIIASEYKMYFFDVVTGNFLFDKEFLDSNNAPRKINALAITSSQLSVSVLEEDIEHLPNPQKTSRIFTYSLPDVSNSIHEIITHTTKKSTYSYDQSPDYFGMAVAIKDNLALVTSYDNNYEYIVNRINVDTKEIISTISNRGGDSLAISNNYFFIGNTNTERVYVFNKESNDQIGIMAPPVAEGNNFGCSIVTNNEITIVGSNTGAYVFDNNTRNLLFKIENPAPDGNFGMTVKLYGDIIAVSGFNEQGVENLEYPTATGKVYLFNKNTYSLIRVLMNPNPVGYADNDGFGGSIALSNNICLVGAPYEDNGSGKAYQFNITTGLLMRTFNNPFPINERSNDNFGSSVAISNNKIIIAAENKGLIDLGTYNSLDGEIYIFDLISGSLIDTLVNPNRKGLSNFDVFGKCIDVSDNHLIVGCYKDDNENGTVYVYDCSNFPKLTKDIFENQLQAFNIYDLFKCKDFVKSALEYMQVKYPNFEGYTLHNPSLYRNLDSIGNSVYLPYMTATKNNGLFNQIKFRFPIKKLIKNNNNIYYGLMEFKFNVNSVGTLDGLINVHNLDSSEFVFNEESQINVPNITGGLSILGLDGNISGSIRHETPSIKYVGNYWDNEKEWMGRSAISIGNGIEFDLNSEISKIIPYMQSALDSIKANINNEFIQNSFLDIFNDYWDGDPSTVQTSVWAEDDYGNGFYKLNLEGRVIYDPRLSPPDEHKDSIFPGFNEPFHEYYDQYSISVDDLVIPEHFSRYVPDNQDDYNCTLVIVPNPNFGASKWIHQGKFITIGIYRDEGRATAVPPPTTNLTWVRSGVNVIVTSSNKHKLKPLDYVNLWNINIPEMLNVQIESVPDAYTFTFRGFLTGPTSGSNAAYQPVAPTNFYETHRVFRLLPSFKLITIDQLNEIFALTAPTNQPARRTIYNVTLDSEVQIPKNKTKTTNYELPSQVARKEDLLSLNRRFNQAYDENGEPLKLNYEDTGFVTPTYNVDNKTKNKQTFLNKPVFNEATDADQDNDSRIYVYDYYGIDLNDPGRGPHFSSDNVYRDTSVDGMVGNLKVRLDNLDNPIYSSTLNDDYGNLAIGVQENNALFVRKQILPLVLDVFNKPVKKPI